MFEMSDCCVAFTTAGFTLKNYARNVSIEEFSRPEETNCSQLVPAIA
jgi:hypothetical protein